MIVDSQLAKETNIGVQEMMNGCLCCVLVGQMKLALLELKGNGIEMAHDETCTHYSTLPEKYNPDRIIVETR